MSEEIAEASADRETAIRQAARIAELERRLSAFEALLEPPAPAPPPAAIAAILDRWEAVRWRSTTERERNYVANVALVDAHDVPLLDLEEPSQAELATIALAAEAPGDIRLLLGLARRLERIEAAVRNLIEAWADLPQATPLDLDISALAVAYGPRDPARAAALASGEGELFE